MSPSIFAKIIESYLPEPHASLLNGILFGISLKTSKEFYQQLKTVGLLHIVVLSGTNITLLSAVIANLTQSLGRLVSCLLTILTIIFFIIFVGPQAPIVRAGIMGILTLGGVVFGRRNFSLYGLFLSAIFIAVFYPRWLKSLSFYLSYSATLGIVLFGEVKVKKPKNYWEKIKIQVWKEFKPSLAAQIFTAPIIFLFFRQISLIAPLSNLLVAPFIPSLMIFGFLASILGKINYFLGLPFAYICFVILEYIVFVINFLSKIPFVFIQF